jgi:hypothetical protein
MPNGGSDCCGTCWFFEPNAGRAGYPDEHRVPAEPRCVIRDLLIENPFWTYCANHPHHTRRRIDLPIGPVLVCDLSYPYERRVWEQPPDTEALRLRLLEMLDTMPEQPVSEYPSQTQLDAAIIDQLAVYGERRAIPGIRRVLRFDPFAAPEDNPFGQYRFHTIGHAIEALAMIASDDALPDIERLLHAGLTPEWPASSHEDGYPAMRYHAVRALRFCRSPRGKELLEHATSDPHEDVRAFAREILREKHSAT